MLGSAADFAMCVSAKSEDAGGFKTLILFETEAHGQDSCATGVSASGNKVRILKQYKYSSRPDEYKISKSELLKIVSTLKESARRANRAHRLETHLVLCTNREITKPAQKCAEYRSIRHEKYDAATATEVMTSYARTFGIFNPDELALGVQRVTHYLFSVATSSSHTLSKSDFEEALIGHKEPRSLVLAEAAPRLMQELSVLAQHTLRLEPNGLADRQSLRMAAPDLLYEGIVAFVGEGGCGKTTAIWQLLRQALADQPPYALSHMMLSHGQPSRSVAEVIERWRGTVTPANILSDEHAITRVLAANPSSPKPVVILGLDGVDEIRVSSAWAETTARVLDYFWDVHVHAKRSGEYPVARLFVSCREEADLQRLLPDPTGTGESDLKPRYVHFGEFTSTELQELAWNSPNLDHRSAQRISELLRHESQSSELLTGLPATVLPSSSTPSSLKLLKHPILWRSFSSLSAEEQLAVLDGSAGSGQKLAAAFLNWFRDRTKRRIDIQESYLPVALRAVASSCPESSGPYRLQTWVEVMLSAAGFTVEQATAVYHECVSSGLVQDIRPAGGPGSHRSWRWKHMFVAAHLRRSEGTQE